MYFIDTLPDLGPFIFEWKTFKFKNLHDTPTIVMDFFRDKKKNCVGDDAAFN